MITLRKPPADEALAALPLEHHEGGESGDIVQIVLSLLWLGFFINIMINIARENGLDGQLLIGAVFLLLGFWGLVSGVAAWTRRLTLRIDEDAVQLRCRTLFSHTEWREPLDAYRGVFYHTKVNMGSGNNRGPSMTKMVDLQHPRQDRCVRLLEETAVSQEDARSFWMCLAERLNVARIEEDGNREVMHPPAAAPSGSESPVPDPTGDLPDAASVVMHTVGAASDCPVSSPSSTEESAARTPLGDVATRLSSSGFDPASPPPDGVACAVDGERLDLTLRTRTIRKFDLIVCFLMMILFCAIAIGVGTNGCSTFRALNILGSLFFCMVPTLIFCVFAGIYWWQRQFETHLRLSPQEVRLVQVEIKRGRETTKSAWTPGQITDVVVSKTVRHNSKWCLQIVSGAKPKELGYGLSLEALEWLRDTLLASLQMVNAKTENADASAATFTSPV